MDEPTPAEAAQRQAALDRAAKLAHEASFAARDAKHNAAKLADGIATADLASDAARAAWDCLQLLLRAGAASPLPTTVRPQTDSLNLSSLSALADPETDDLLFHLEQCLAVAERIDARRGRVVSENIPLSPGESRGTDLAETISEIALRVRGKVHGPQTGQE